MSKNAGKSRVTGLLRPEPFHFIFGEYLRAVVQRTYHATPPKAGDGGAYRDRTDDLMLAKQPLSQLS